MKKILSILLISMVGFVFIACQTKEEKYLSLQKDCIEMLEEINNGSKLDASPKMEKCMKIYTEFTDIEKECNFTSEQESKANENTKEILKLEAQIGEKFGNNFGY